MTLTFLLAGVTSFPAGGFKVVFEHANRLARDGHTVNIVMGAVTISPRTTFAALFRYPYYKVTHNYAPTNWFSLHPNIHCYYFFTLAEGNIPKSDVIIATAVETAFYLNKYTSFAKKMYFIQGFEDWAVSAKKVYETYSFPLKKMVIAPWLQELVRAHGSDAVLVPNGFDFDYFKLSVPVESRNRMSVLMMYHTMARKRCSDCIAALQLVKQRFPCLNIKMFGRPKKPSDVPFEFEYYQAPDKETHNRLYNESAIYVAASSVEGWGLTVGEAMICGCAVACTDNKGFKTMAYENETALLSPVYDYKKLAENIICLIENDDLRIRLAKAANKNIQQYTWDNSYKKFKETIFD